MVRLANGGAVLAALGTAGRRPFPHRSYDGAFVVRPCQRHRMTRHDHLLTHQTHHYASVGWGVVSSTRSDRASSSPAATRPRSARSTTGWANARNGMTGAT